MGFLPFVSQGRKRDVWWHRLVLVWLAVILAATFGTCTIGYILTSDWRFGAYIGVAMGVVFAATAINRLLAFRFYDQPGANVPGRLLPAFLATNWCGVLAAVVLLLLGGVLTWPVAVMAAGMLIAWTAFIVILRLERRRAWWR